jgi:hypothetical protein
MEIKSMTFEEMVQRVAQIARHRDSLHREQWLESQGWQVRKAKINIDGYEDPENPEIYDLETAFLLAQTRDIMRLLETPCKSVAAYTICDIN